MLGEAGRSGSELAEILLFALQNYPGQVSMVDAAAFTARTRLGSRSGKKRAAATLLMDPELVRSLRLPPEERPWTIMMVAVRTEAVERSESAVALPGEKRP